MKNIWVNGCFDILHVGHIRLFKYARAKGERLIVGIDSDERVRELKGEGRPFNNQYDRKELLEALSFIDEVVIFNSEESMCSIIREKKIDMIVIGDEYRNKKVVGSDIAPVDFYNKIPGYSSSSILRSKRYI